MANTESMNDVDPLYFVPEGMQKEALGACLWNWIETAKTSEGLRGMKQMWRLMR